jgi:two-component system cell cycle sensor histidine kinase/response regulator CckA
MGEFFKRLFASDLMPHGVCWAWEPWAVWGNVLPDAVIALSYFALSLTLVHLIHRRRELAYSWIVLLFGTFIFACGLNHAMEVWNTWHGAFRLAGAIKVVTAAASLGTTLMLFRLAPKILRAPGLERSLELHQSLSTERVERRNAERLLGESQERQRLLIEGVQDYAIFMLDPEGLIVSWNAGAERIKGYRAEEVLGRHFSLFYDAGQVADGLPARELAEASAEGVYRTEGERVRKDGSRFQAHITITALRDGQGQLKGFAKVTRDITQQVAAEARLKAFNQDLATMVQARTQELHESEARLQGFIHHAPAAIAFKGPGGQFMLVNPRMETLLGRPEAEILGRTIRELYPDPLGTALHEADQALAASGHASEQEEQWTHADGEVHDYLSQKFALVDGTGRRWGLGMLSTDITDRKEAARTLLQSQKLESMGLLAGGIAHDFNNLLGAILGNLGLAQMEISPMAPARQRLETIEGLVVRASDLARQMLAYSGRGKFQLKTVNLNDLVREMTHLLGISISKKAVIRYALDPQLPSIEADPSQLQQVVMNLVINASDAIGERSGTITIGTHPLQLDEEHLARAYAGQNLVPGAYVCLEVADNGCGMPPEIMNRIFDPFFTTKFTGRGLGLAAIQGIVRGHRGGIQVQSEPNRGTTFKLLFPATSLAAEVQVPKETLGSYRGTGTVLVVDDEESIRAMAAGILGHIGFQAIQAEDGLDALKQLRLHEPEICLVIMDLTMPHLDGEETYRAMRQEGFTTPVILSSGFNETEAVNRFMGRGLAGFLQKPYRAADMVKMVRGVLDQDAPSSTPAS